MSRSKSKRKKPSSRRRKAPVPVQGQPQGLRMVSYEVTHDPMADPAFEALPPGVQQRYQALYEAVVARPAACIAELEALVSAHPEVPKSFNLLSAAYSQSGQAPKAEAHIRETIERHPDYLFARLNYAELCLRQGKLNAIPGIFDHKFDLSTLYPGRTVFHITEVVSFAGVMAQYFFLTGRLDTAEVYRKTLLKLAPKHPMTRHVEGLMGGMSWVSRLRRGRR
jgi:tetratricopeptide (TPR) repeat protein